MPLPGDPAEYTLRQLGGLILDLRATHAWTLAGTCAGLLVLAFLAGKFWEDKQSTERSIEVKTQLSETRIQLAQALAESHSAKEEVGSLRDANQQKVCLDAQWTSRQRAISARRLQVAATAILKDLQAHPLDPKGTELPVHQFRFQGLEGFDPTLFYEDDATVQGAHALAGSVNTLNILLDRMRVYDLLPVGGKETGWPSIKQHYEARRSSAVVEATSLLSHLEDRYKPTAARVGAAAP